MEKNSPPPLEKILGAPLDTYLMLFWKRHLVYPQNPAAVRHKLIYVGM